MHGVRETSKVEIEAAGQLDMDVAGCDQLTLFSSQGGFTAGQQHEEMHGLTEMLHGARVGLEIGDVSMEDLMAGVEGLTT